jgi:hypothetical protein
LKYENTPNKAYNGHAQQKLVTPCMSDLVEIKKIKKMSEIIPIQDNRPTGQSPQQLDLDTFKSVFYWVNAKPDTQIKAFEGRKKISLSEIRYLKDGIDKKLKLHLVENYIASINFILTEGNIKDYGSWAEFERENWNTINSRTRSINITWDMTLALPGFAIPQRHTLKLRIGAAIPPKDMFQIMFTSDDSSELVELRADAVCKVDFVNQTLANELMLIVDNWYQGLQKVDEAEGFQKFLTDKQQFIIVGIANFTPVIVFFIYHLYFSLFCAKNIVADNINLVSLQSILVTGMFVFTIGILLGKYYARWTDKRIDKFKHYSGFLISKGDENYNIEIIKENNKNKDTISKRAFLGVVTAVVSVCVKYLIEHFLLNQ